MSDSPLWDLLPRLPGAYLHEFTRAYEAHQAAGELLRLANKSLPGMAPELLERRKTLLHIPFQIIVAERNNALDGFCAAWIKHRGGQVDSSRGPSTVGSGGPEASQSGVQEAVSRPLSDAPADDRSNHTSPLTPNPS